MGVGIQRLPGRKACEGFPVSNVEGDKVANDNEGSKMTDNSMTPLEQGKAFWDDSPKSLASERGHCGIMFQVGNNIPVYCYDVLDWADYIVASFPARTTTMLFVEGTEDMHAMLWGLRTARIIGNCLSLLNDGIDWDEHNGVTTA